MKATNKTTLFLILTFGISFSVAGIYKLFDGPGTGTVGFTLLGTFYMFIPTICVLIVQKLIHKESIKTDLMLSFKINKWFFVAWLLMPIIMFATIGINLLFPNVSFNPEMTGFFERLSNTMTPQQMTQMTQQIHALPINVVWIILGQGLLAGISINALAGFGEELGWRGFLLKAFKEMQFYKASILIGLIWGIWHAPLILMGHNYPQHPQIGVLMMTIMCILLTPLLLYITIKSKSVIAAAIMHGTMNATAGISIMGIKGGTDLSSGIAGLAGFITMALVLFVLFVYDYYISKDQVLTRRISENL